MGLKTNKQTGYSEDKQVNKQKRAWRWLVCIAGVFKTAREGNETANECEKHGTAGGGVGVRRAKETPAVDPIVWISAFSSLYPAPPRGKGKKRLKFRLALVLEEVSISMFRSARSE